MPQSKFLPPCLTLCIRVPNPISGSLFTLVFLVMPSHARADLFKIYVLAVEQYLAQYPLIAVEIMVFDHDNLTGNQVG
jgi:hypothetical protein